MRGFAAGVRAVAAWGGCLLLAACGSGDGPLATDEPPTPAGAGSLMQVRDGRVHLALDPAMGSHRPRALLYSVCGSAPGELDALSEESVPFVPRRNCQVHMSGLEWDGRYLVPDADRGLAFSVTTNESAVEDAIAVGEARYVEAMTAPPDIAALAIVATVEGERVTLRAAARPLSGADAGQCTRYELRPGYSFENASERLVRVFSARISEAEHGPRLDLPPGATFKERVELASEELCRDLEAPDFDTGEYLAGLEVVEATVLSTLDPSDPDSAPATVELRNEAAGGEVTLRCDIVCRHCEQENDQGEESPTTVFSFDDMEPEIYGQVLLPRFRLGNIPTFVQPVGWQLYGKHAYKNQATDFSYVAKNDTGATREVSVTLTTDVASTSPFNALGWQFYRGNVDQSYKTLPPSHPLGPVAILGISFAPGVLVPAAFPHHIAPNRYQVFLNGRDISGVVEVRDGGRPMSGAIRAEVTLPDYTQVPYTQSDIEVVMYYDLLAGQDLWIPYGLGAGSALFLEYEFTHDPAPVTVEFFNKTSGKYVDIGVSGVFPRYSEMRPPGTDLLPISNPWYPEPAFSTTSGAMTPTIGFWDRRSPTIIEVSRSSVVPSNLIFGPGNGHSSAIRGK